MRGMFFFSDSFFTEEVIPGRSLPSTAIVLCDIKQLSIFNIVLVKSLSWVSITKFGRVSH